MKYLKKTAAWIIMLPILIGGYMLLGLILLVERFHKMINWAFDELEK